MEILESSGSNIDPCATLVDIHYKSYLFCNAEAHLLGIFS